MIASWKKRARKGNFGAGQRHSQTVRGELTTILPDETEFESRNQGPIFSTVELCFTRSENPVLGTSSESRSTHRMDASKYSLPR